MRIVELIREKTQKINLVNLSTESFELQMRELRASLSERFATGRAGDIWERLSQFSPAQDRNRIGIDPQVQDYCDCLSEQLDCEIYQGDWLEISQSCIDAFSQVTQDKQWIHLDLERARLESPYRTTIAPGFLILSMIPTLRNYESLGQGVGKSVRIVVNCGLGEVRFINPVKSGKRIRARSLLKKIETKKKCVEVTERITIDIEPGIKCACVADVVYRVYL